MSNMSWEDQKGVLLEGLEEGTTRYEATERLLENSRRDLGRHKSGEHTETLAEGQQINENTNTTGQFARYDKLLMPLVRRVMPALFAMDLVGVQPMNMPVGMIRTARFRYADDVQESSDPTDGLAVEADTEASGMNVFEKYSKIAAGEPYNSADSMNPFEQTEALEGQGGNRMVMDVVKQTVEAESRKLQAVWTYESDEDAKALDGLDIENEMVTNLADEISREMDQELLGELRSLAGSVQALDFATADGRYAGEKFTALSIGLSELSSGIAKATKLGGATWAVMSQDMVTALRHASNTAFTPASQDTVYENSLFAGTLHGRIKVYIDPYLEGNNVLMGYKGSDTRSGFFYCPYVPITSSGVVMDPVTFNPRLSLRSRYAYATFTDDTTSLGNSSDYYARASVANLSLGFGSA